MVTQMMNILDDDHNNTVSRNEFIAAVEAGKLDALIKISQRDGAELIQSGDLTQSHTLSAERRALIAERMSERQPPERTVETQDIEGGRGNAHELVDIERVLSLGASLPLSPFVFPCLLKGLTGLLHAEAQYNYLWQMFNIADDDGSGEIDLEELQSLLSDETVVGAAVASVMTPARVEKVMEDIDEE